MDLYLLIEFTNIMKIYEKIKYWDDACNVTNITQTILLTDKHEVNNKIEEFKESSSNTRELFTNYGDNSSGLDYIYFTYVYGSDFFTLEVREHSIKV